MPNKVFEQNITKQSAINDGINDYREILSLKEAEWDEFLAQFDFYEKDDWIDKLKDFSPEIKIRIFKRWFEFDSLDCLESLEKFGILSLPESIQHKIAIYLEKKSNDADFNVRTTTYSILNHLSNIIDSQLRDFLVKTSNFDILAENKEKLHGIGEDIILRKLKDFNRNYNPSQEWICWSYLIPYIDKFKTVNKQEAIDGCIKQPVNNGSELIIKHKTKLNLTDRQLVDLFFDVGKWYVLLQAIEYIDSSFHQEIVDRVIGLAAQSKISKKNGKSSSEYWVARVIFENSKKLRNIDVPKLFWEMDQLGGYFLFKENLKFCDNIEWGKHIPDHIIKNFYRDSPVDLLYYRLFKLHALYDHQKIINTLFAEKYFSVILDIGKDNGVSFDSKLALWFLDNDKAWMLGGKLYLFENLSKEVAMKLIDKGLYGRVIGNLDHFVGLDTDVALSLLLKCEDDINIVKKIQLFFQLKNIIKELKTKYFGQLVPDWLYLHFGEKTDWQEKLGEKPVNEFLDVLPKSKERDEKRNAFTHNEYDRTSEFLQYLNKYELFNVNGVDFEIATDFVKHYGLAKNTLLYEYFRNLQLFNKGKLDSLPPEQVYEDEITSLEILEKKYKTLQQKVFSSQEITAEYLKTLSHFEITLLSQITGKNTHRFDTGRPPFDQIIQDFIAYSEKATEKSEGQVDLFQSEYVPTPEEYKPFELQANKVEYEFDKSNLEKPDSSYNILKKDVLKIFSTETADKDKFLSLKTSAVEKNQAKIKELENKTDNQYIAQQREKLMAVIAKLETLDFKEIKEKGEIKSKSYDELLLQLLDLDKSMIERSGLQDELRQIVFRKMLDQSYGTVDRVERIRTSMQGELNALGILHLLDLIDNFAKDHILNTEKDNKEKYWTDEAWQKIKESNKLDSKFTMKTVFNKQYKELKEVADKMKALDSGKGNFKIQCCPDRGFIGEMSGYLADVCYTAEYPLLARHPNLVPYKFIAEQDSDNKEFLGSVLVFELEDADNNKVALLRAFDIPREHEVNVGEFIENFINKITPGLQARGVKKIIIPGNDGAISNYPLTISHMHKKYINGKSKISLAKSFAFNGYDITDNCYVAREL